MPENRVLIAICTGHAQVERAILELKWLGFDMTNVSVFGRAYLNDEEVVGCYTAAGRLRAHGGSAAFWDRLWNLLGGGGLFLVPGIGPVVVAGPFVRTLVAAIEDGGAVAGSNRSWVRHFTALPFPKRTSSGVSRSRSEADEVRVDCLWFARGNRQGSDCRRKGWRGGNDHYGRIPPEKRGRGSSDCPIGTNEEPSWYVDSTMASREES